MEIVLLAFEVVFPLFIMIFIGYLVQCRKKMSESTLSAMNNLIYSLFLPVLLFLNIYNTDFKNIFNLRLVIFAIVAILTIWAVLMVVVPLFIKDRRKCGAFVLGCCRSNFVIFGLTVTIPLFGQESAGPISILIAVVIPVYSVMSVVILEFFRGERVQFKIILQGIAKNPLIIAAALGLAFLTLGVKMPIVLETPLTAVGGIAAPLAFILLGADLNFTSIQSHFRLLMSAVLLKLVVIPAFAIFGAAAIGLQGLELGAILILFTAPTAVATFSMAQQMDSDERLAGEIIVFTSIFSILTVFLWIVLLKLQGMI